jgi:hypothetical protein
MMKHSDESRSLRTCQRGSMPTYILAVTLIMMLTNLPILYPSDIAVSAQNDASEIEGFVMGEVTGKRETVLRIDDKEYSWFTDIVVKDQNLTPKSLNDVVPGTQVMFHLKQGRIDQIIILLPS